MLTIILIYFIGKRFYDLSIQFNQKKWLYAILGVLSYYFGAIAIGGVSLGLLDGFFEIGIDWDDDFALGIMAIPFGLLTVYLFYILLKKKWEKTVVIIKDEIEDIGKSIENEN